MARLNFAGSCGTVTAQLDMLPHCCGVVVISRVVFDRGAGKYKQLFEEFQEYLLARPHTHVQEDHLGRAVYLMSDAVDNRSAGTIYSFCRSMGWDESPIARNHRSGNRIQIFTLDRKKVNEERLKKSKSFITKVRSTVNL